MPALIILEVGLQLLCAVHVMRTRRPYYWVFIILAFPLLGSLAYAIAEILPEFLNSRPARNVASGAVKLIDPDRDYRALVDQLDTADTADNRRALAEECLRRGEAERAVLLYEASLTGAHKDDPTLMFGLARALFARGEFAACSRTLEALKAANPRFDSADAHLLYARSLESQNRVAEAKSEYDVLVRSFPGAEARCRYALMLQQQGETGGRPRPLPGGRARARQGWPPLHPRPARVVRPGQATARLRLVPALGLTSGAGSRHLPAHELLPRRV